MPKYFIAVFGSGTRQFLVVEDGEPDPYPAFKQYDEQEFLELRRARNRARKKEKKERKNEG